jgi:hypothetical protein
MNDASLSQSRFRALLAAYGARPEYWPERERKAAIELLESSETARALAREQQALDTWLTMSSPPALPTKLVEHLNAVPEKRGTVLLARRLHIRALWVPALGWAAAAAVGIWLGARSAGADSTVAKSAAVDDTVAQRENERLALSGGMLGELEEP